MMKSHTFNYHQLIALFLFTFVISSVQGQTKEFNGDYQIGKLKGNATFSYKLRANDTILDGPFLFNDKGIQSLEESVYQSFSVEGDFSNNQPNGDWTLSFGNYIRDKQPKLVDYSYVINVNGLLKKVKGSFNDGIPKGEFIITIDSIKNSEVAKNLFKSTINFQNGVPQKSFTMESDSHAMVGRLLRNGVAHDKWTLFENENLGEVENWFFKEGILTKISIQKDGIAKEINVFENKDDNYKLYPLNRNYLTVVELTHNSSDTNKIVKNGIGGLLEKNLNTYGKVKGFMNQLGDSVSFPNFQVKLPFYPLDENNAAILKNVVDSIQKAEQLSNALLTNAQLSIQKLSNENTKFHYSVTEVISKDYLSPLSRLKNYSEENIVIHFNPKRLLEKLWPNGLPSGKIEIERENNQSRVYQAKNASNYNPKDVNLQEIEKLTYFTLANLEYLHEKLIGEITSQQREEAFLVQEKELIAQLDHLKKHIDSLKKSKPKEIQTTLESMKGFADNLLNEYSAMDENSEKLDYAKELTNCFSRTEEFATSISKLPVQMKEIKELYQDPVWNPFTATVMNEDIKKKITKAYENILIPYQLKNIQTDLKCSNMDSIEAFFERLNNRMVELFEEDTSRLERKLRKEKNPQEIIELFGLNDNEIEK
ncbi:hypothetical protein [Galbibacter mesophilus]|uniref:hypothetical protein n=1 Tax=Galbibacter mesophilus TaxID=379069 RepID=UPI00191F894E|nr:hypothetical protein [Galbibacter mesophilus]MCM5664105.1 hypothetical protein [Galbibacter mesophilus]